MLAPLPRMVAAAVLLGLGAAQAEDKPATTRPARQNGGLLPGASAKEPVSVDAGKLDYFDKEAKLVYAGDVVAKQGESTLRASVLTIFLNRDAKPSEGSEPSTQPAGPAGSSIRRMEAQGPVTVVSKDEVGTGDTGSYDKAENRITLTGNVTLTQATNIVKGDKLVYDMNTGQAQVTSGQTAGRVRSVFTPGSASGGTGLPRKGKPGEPPRKSQTAGEP